MHILVINAGSSSVKFSVYTSSLELVFRRNIDRLNDITSGIQQIPQILKANNINSLAAIGHRVVHGGQEFSQAVLVTKEVLEKLKKLQPLAPLHQPHNLKAIEIFAALMPDVPQIACFDTAFHSTQPKLNKILTLPHEFYDEGLIRYGFHGLSYQYIASQLPQYSTQNSHGKVIVAHLGNGCSVCAMQNLQSVATSMGFSTLDGLMMGSRTGSIDPGVLLYLMQEKNYSAGDLEKLLYKESGLLGIAGIGSNNMLDILASTDEKAKCAFELFCLISARNIASLTVCIGGLDVLVFTAGIGENSPEVRQRICYYLQWMDIKIDAQANTQNSRKISLPDSKDIFIIPTNEDASIIEGISKFL